MIYSKHIFICNNQRAADAAKPSCGEEHGNQLVSEFKKKIKERGLQMEIRAQKTGCFDLCEQGPAIAVYPEGVFYGKVQLSDIDEIIESHLINGSYVERLLIHAK